jgi:hypothetical protein
MTFIPCKKTIAIIGIKVSGKAVPTAANTLPVKFLDTFNLCPRASIPFVNSSAAAKTKSIPTTNKTKSRIINPSPVAFS